ncbi:hypothetical protein ABXJ76_07855 [Methylobacter sp. G7]|uniref:hypothetical protein n=1 Tax=Methylobacter sp. G7 TaxID=3230117 RepID=UPI003D809FB2
MNMMQMEHDLTGKLCWWSKLNRARQTVLLSMAYDMGLAGLLQMTRFLSLAERGEYARAAEDMLNSDWARENDQRARELSAMMATGAELPE